MSRSGASNSGLIATAFARQNPNLSTLCASFLALQRLLFTQNLSRLTLQLRTSRISSSVDQDPHIFELFHFISLFHHPYIPCKSRSLHHTAKNCVHSGHIAQVLPFWSRQYDYLELSIFFSTLTDDLSISTALPPSFWLNSKIYLATFGKIVFPHFLT